LVCKIIQRELPTEILAQFETGVLKEKYVRLDYPKELPVSDFWVYKKSNEGQCC
jgi:hypothetical protein